MDEPALADFYVATQGLRKALERDLPLDDFERICLENYIALLQITYIKWKQRNRKPHDYKSAA